LAWEAPERTTASAVVLYDTDLAEVARLDAGEAEEFLLQSKMISTPESVAFVRVVFAANGDEIGRSQARTLTF
jgi:glycerophosphoryl diester phosphodiesterase